MTAAATNWRVLARSPALLPVALAIVAGALLPTFARADSDPASDVLLAQSAFLPADAGASAKQEARLDVVPSQSLRGLSRS